MIPQGCGDRRGVNAIRGLPPTSRCYEDALLLLKKRFGNEDILVQTHMRKLLDLQPVRDADDVRGLRRLYDTIISHLRGLEALGQKHQTFGALLFPVVQRALPKEILLDFNRTIVNEQASDMSTLQLVGCPRDSRTLRNGRRRQAPLNEVLCHYSRGCLPF